MAARHWTDEQRKAQAEKIKTYQPWRMSTGAITQEGKKKVSQNALKTGEYTADKVKERKRKAANKKLLGSLCSYGDKRFRWDRSLNYCSAFRTLGKANREKIKNKLREAATATE
ncbi:MAG: hypothetical protein KDI39_00900 [Pseudomonadales bacterium]|nr:hypothetical protein [Pseudomonadales bacterium]